MRFPSNLVHQCNAQNSNNKVAPKTSCASGTWPSSTKYLSGSACRALTLNGKHGWDCTGKPGRNLRCQSSRCPPFCAVAGSSPKPNVHSRYMIRNSLMHSTSHLRQKCLLVQLRKCAFWKVDKMSTLFGSFWVPFLVVKVVFKTLCKTSQRAQRMGPHWMAAKLTDRMPTTDRIQGHPFPATPPHKACSSNADMRTVEIQSAKIKTSLFLWPEKSFYLRKTTSLGPPPWPKG